MNLLGKSVLEEDLVILVNLWNNKVFLATKELWKAETELALEYGLQKQYLVITTNTPQLLRERYLGDLSKGTRRGSGLCATSPERMIRNR